METDRLLTKLRQGETVLGVCNMYPASGIVEGMCEGWDFVWLDGQHGEMDYAALLHAMQAADAMGLETVLRVPGHEHSVLGMYADLDPTVVMVPMVNTAEQARHLVAGLRFAPLGARSYGGRRIIDRRGGDFYLKRQWGVVAQTETIEGLRNAAAIIATEGIDGLFFGADDMKIQMGIPVSKPTLECPEILDALRQTARATRAAGKWCGCIAASREVLAATVEMGYRMLVGGSDIMFLRTAAAAQLRQLRAGLATDGPAPTAPRAGGAY